MTARRGSDDIEFELEIKKAPTIAGTMMGADNGSTLYADYDFLSPSADLLKVNVERCKLAAVRVAPHANVKRIVAQIDSQFLALVRGLDSRTL